MIRLWAALLLLPSAAQEEKTAFAFRVKKGDRFSVATSLKWRTDAAGMERDEEVQSTVAWAVGDVDAAGLFSVGGTFKKFKRTNRRTGAVEVDWSEGKELAALPEETRAALKEGIAARLTSRGAMASETRALPIIFHQSGGGLFGTLCTLPQEPMKPGDTWTWGGLGTAGHGQSVIDTTFEKIESGSAILRSRFRSDEVLRNQLELFHGGDGVTHYDLRAGFPVRSSGRYRQIGRDTKKMMTAAYEFEVTFTRQ